MKTDSGAIFTGYWFLLSTALTEQRRWVALMLMFEEEFAFVRRVVG
jgi:hypothetical protein